jgi:hypothetical protein
VLDAKPEIWQTIGDLQRLVEKSWIDRIAGTDLLTGQSIRRQLEKLKKGLAGPTPSPPGVGR